MIEVRGAALGVLIAVVGASCASAPKPAAQLEPAPRALESPVPCVSALDAKLRQDWQAVQASRPTRTAAFDVLVPGNATVRELLQRHALLGVAVVAREEKLLPVEAVLWSEEPEEGPNSAAQKPPIQLPLVFPKAVVTRVRDPEMAAALGAFRSEVYVAFPAQWLWKKGRFWLRYRKQLKPVPGLLTPVSESIAGLEAADFAEPGPKARPDFVSILRILKGRYCLGQN